MNSILNYENQQRYVPHPKTYKDYWPISVIWHIGKIAQTAFLKIYKAHVIPKLSAHQYAYIPSLGTVNTRVKMIDDWTIMMDSKDKDNVGVQVILKDFSKAFDMQPSIFVEKLQNLANHPGLIKLCMDFLKDRKQIHCSQE